MQPSQEGKQRLERGVKAVSAILKQRKKALVLEGLGVQLHWVDVTNPLMWSEVLVNSNVVPRIEIQDSSKSS